VCLDRQRLTDISWFSSDYIIYYYYTYAATVDATIAITTDVVPDFLTYCDKIRAKANKTESGKHELKNYVFLEKKKLR